MCAGDKQMMGEYSHMPHRPGVIHFVGIGGVGMSGIAEVMLNLGYQVQGSDARDGASVMHLRESGARIFVGHRAENILGCDVVVMSSAIAADNPETGEARRRRIPVLQRAEMLAELMRFRFGIAIAGTHGKTTTTSLVAAALSEAGLDPTYIAGGRIMHLKGGAGLGRGRYLVAEADESDASFLHLNPVIAVVTNVDKDHLNAYDGSFPALRRAFHDFLLQLPFYGTAVVCQDDPALREFSHSIARNFLTYGFDEGGDIRAVDFSFSGMVSTFTVSTPWNQSLTEFRINLPGRHNILNALAAFGVCHCLGVGEEVVGRAFARFAGIARRSQMLGEISSGDTSIIVVDDYGHHPAEISASLEAARCAWPERRLLLAFQPHRYTRTRALFDDFVAVLSQADVLVLLDVYPAGEAPIEGADSRALFVAISKKADVEVIHVSVFDQATETVAGIVMAGDLVLTMGAGSISTLAPALLKELQRHARA